jgi:hypothetical protein
MIKIKYILFIILPMFQGNSLSSLLGSRKGQGRSNYEAATLYLTSTALQDNVQVLKSQPSFWRNISESN